MNITRHIYQDTYGGFILADEFCHRGYDEYDEEIRYDDLLFYKLDT